MKISIRVPSAPAVVLVFAVLFQSGSNCSAQLQSANRYYRRGQAAEAQKDIAEAYAAYKQAYELKPAELKYRVTYDRIRIAAAAAYVRQGEHFEAEGNFAPALAAYLKALDADPANEMAESDARGLERRLESPEQPIAGENRRATEATRPEGPARLDIEAKGPVTLHMVEDSRILYQTVGKLLGLNILFDPAYSSKRIQVDLNDVTPWEALRIVAEVSNTFWKPVTHNTIFVAEDTRAKRTQYAQEAVQVFYLKNVSQANDFTEVQQVLRNLFQTARINGVAGNNAIVVRGTPDELQLAKMLIAGLDEARPEVLVDISVMEVSHDKLREIGLSPPTSLTVNSGSSQTLEQIGHTSAYSIAIGQAAVDFLLTDSDTRILQNPRLRALDGQKADLKIGERIPVATGSYTVPTSTTAAASETQFTYLDVGVNIEMTPAIHADRDVTLKLAVELSSQTSSVTIEGVTEPVISQEKADQVVRLKNGESTILAGLLQRQTSQSASGWPGFGEIPLMKYFFTTQQHELKTDELVFLITPHIVRAPRFDPEVDREIDTGTETAVQLREAPGSPMSSGKPR